ncbi:cobalamin B12-binding domain-containing protein [Paucibacter sp. O1-1]|nr:cobalamin B12-binding domain-containing protein [Paucibacter sp. O1-1]MDA3824864.1 cobalamin B12-binding domain-containing protein [Paucibacter sp. O1-1]
MAGWTHNRLAKRQQAPLPGADGSRSGSATGDESLHQPDPPTLAELLARKSAELVGQPRQLSFDEERPRLSSPHLVASNTGQDMQLSRIVELEIIPRLMLMHSTQPLQNRPPLPAMVLTVDHVHTLAHLSAEGESDSAGSYVRALLDAGASQEQVFLDLLAPCARWLGQMWDDDRYDFSQVTIALWRLQRVLHEQGSRFNQVVQPDADSHRALLAAVPGAQHTFGVIMAAEFFSRAGWDVECEPKASWPDLQARLNGGWFDMFGLSIATGDSIAHVASAILDMREASANPLIFVMVGGPMAAELPNLAALCGADAMACEAGSAVATANCGVGRRVKQA